MLIGCSGAEDPAAPDGGPLVYTPPTCRLLPKPVEDKSESNRTGHNSARAHIPEHLSTEDNLWLDNTSQPCPYCSG
ncbi:hypothetical protein JZ751_001422 [Albula glossodonta]|uniref:Uncharacterized protein n=1 Tax=Albula glossodonta TaxID=121402 RepID=A0A8T2PTP3_9TELE|nr:hypothetical protein JZ751_001422 [Albula glossodonta]